MNAVHLTGRLTRDPELHHANDTDICRMRLAVDGPKDPTFIDITAFGALGANCGQYLAQGRAVAVSGRLAYREWQTDDGSKRSKHEVIANQIDFLPRGQTTEARDPGRKPAEEATQPA